MPQSPNDIWSQLLATRGLQFSLTDDFQESHTIMIPQLQEKLADNEIYLLAQQALQRVTTKDRYELVLPFCILAHCSAMLKEKSILAKLSDDFNDLKDSLYEQSFLEDTLSDILKKFEAMYDVIDAVISSDYYAKLLQWDTKVQQVIQERSESPESPPDETIPATQVSPSEIVDPQIVAERQCIEYETEQASEKHKFFMARVAEIPQNLPECLVACWILSLLNIKFPDLQVPKQFQRLPIAAEEIKKLLPTRITMSSEQQQLIDEAIKKNRENMPLEAVGKLELLWEKMMKLDVRKIEKVSKQNRAAASQIDGQSIILFIGMSGAGKSTLIQKLLGYTILPGKLRGMNTLIAQNLRQQHGGLVSGPQQKSITRWISAYSTELNGEKIVLVDSPGFEDSESYAVDIANSITSVESYQKAKTVKVVLVISQRSWGDRAIKIIQLSRILSSMINFACIPTVIFWFSKFTPQELAALPSRITEILNTNELSKAQQSFFKLMKTQVEKPKFNWDILIESTENILSVISQQKGIKSPKTDFKLSIINVQSIVKIAVQSWKELFLHYLQAGLFLEVQYYRSLIKDLFKAFGEVSEGFDVAKQPQQLDRMIQEKGKSLSSKRFETISLSLTFPEAVFQQKLAQSNKIIREKQQLEKVFGCKPTSNASNDLEATLIANAVAMIKGQTWPFELGFYMKNLISVAPFANERIASQFREMESGLMDKLNQVRDKAKRKDLQHELRQYLTALEALKGVFPFKQGQLLEQFDKIASKGMKKFCQILGDSENNGLIQFDIIRVNIDAPFISGLQQQIDTFEFIGQSRHKQLSEIGKTKAKMAKEICSQAIRKSCEFIGKVIARDIKLDFKGSRQIKTLLERAQRLAEANFILADDKEQLLKSSTSIAECSFEILENIKATMARLRQSMETTSEIERIQKLLAIVKNFEGLCSRQDRKQISDFKAEITMKLLKLLESVNFKPINVYSLGKSRPGSFRTSIELALRNLELIDIIDLEIIGDESLNNEYLQKCRQKALDTLERPFDGLGLKDCSPDTEEGFEKLSHQEILRKIGCLRSYVEEIEQVDSYFNIPTKIKNSIECFYNDYAKYCERLIKLYAVKTHETNLYLTKSPQPNTNPSQAQLQGVFRSYCSLLAACNQGQAQLSHSLPNKAWGDFAFLQKQFGLSIEQYVQGCLFNEDKKELFEENWRGKCLLKLKTINEKLNPGCPGEKFSRLIMEINDEQIRLKATFRKDLQNTLNEEYLTEDSVDTLIKEAGSTQNLNFIRDKLKSKGRNLSLKLNELLKQLRFESPSIASLYKEMGDFIKSKETVKALRRFESSQASKMSLSIDFDRMDETFRLVTNQFIERTASTYVKIMQTILNLAGNVEDIRTVNRVTLLVTSFDSDNSMHLLVKQIQYFSNSVINEQQMDSKLNQRIADSQFRPKDFLQSLYDKVKSIAQDKYRSFESIDKKFSIFYENFVIVDELKKAQFDQMIVEGINKKERYLREVFNRDWEAFNQEKRRAFSLLSLLPKNWSEQKKKMENVCSAMERKANQEIEIQKTKFIQTQNVEPFFDKLLELQRAKRSAQFSKLKIFLEEQCREKRTFKNSSISQVVQKIQKDLRPMVLYFKDESSKKSSDIAKIVEANRSEWVNILTLIIAETIRKLHEALVVEHSAKEPLQNSISNPIIIEIGEAYKYLLGESQSIFTNQDIESINRRLSNLIIKNSQKAMIFLGQINTSCLKELSSGKQMGVLLKALNECLNVLRQAENLETTYGHINLELKRLVAQSPNSLSNVRQLFDQKVSHINDYMKVMTNQVVTFNFFQLNVEQHSKQKVKQNWTKIQKQCEIIRNYDQAAERFSQLSLKKQGESQIIGEVSSKGDQLVKVGQSELDSKFTSLEEEPSDVHNQLLLYYEISQESGQVNHIFPSLNQGIKVYREKLQQNKKKLLVENKQKVTQLFQINKSTLIEDENIVSKIKKIKEDLSIIKKQNKTDSETKLKQFQAQINKQNIRKEDKEAKIQKERAQQKQLSNEVIKKATDQYESLMKVESEKSSNNASKRQLAVRECFKTTLGLLRMNTLDPYSSGQFLDAFIELKGIQGGEVKAAFRKEFETLAVKPTIKSQLQSKIPFLRVFEEEPTPDVKTDKSKNYVSLIQKQEGANFNPNSEEGKRLLLRVEKIDEIVNSIVGRITQATVSAKISQIRAFCEQSAKQYKLFENGSTKSVNEPKEIIVGYLFALWCMKNPIKTQKGQSYSFRPNQPQIIAVLLLLNGQKIPAQPAQRRLVELNQGQNKPLVGAIVGSYLAMTDHDVFYICSHSYLTQHLKERFIPLYDCLGIASKIHYVTAEGFCTLMIQQLYDQPFKNELTKELKNQKSSWQPQSSKGYDRLIKKLSESSIILDEASSLLDPNHAVLKSNIYLPVYSKTLEDIFKEMKPWKIDKKVFQHLKNKFPKIQAILQQCLKQQLHVEKGKINVSQPPRSLLSKTYEWITGSQTSKYAIYLKVSQLSFFELLKSVKVFVGLSSVIFSQSKQLSLPVYKDLRLESFSLTKITTGPCMGLLSLTSFCSRSNLAQKIASKMAEARKQFPARPVLIIFCNEQMLEKYSQNSDSPKSSTLSPSASSIHQNPSKYYNVIRKTDSYEKIKLAFECLAAQDTTTLIEMQHIYGVNIAVTDKKVQENGGIYALLVGSYVSKIDLDLVRAKFNQKGTKGKLDYLHVTKDQTEFKAMQQEKDHKLMDYLDLSQKTEISNFVKDRVQIIEKAAKIHNQTLQVYKQADFKKLILLMESLNRFECKDHKRYLFVIEACPQTLTLKKILYQSIVQQLIKLSCTDKTNIDVKFLFFINSRYEESFNRSTDPAEIRQTGWQSPFTLSEDYFEKELDSFKNINNPKVYNEFSKVLNMINVQKADNIIMFLSGYTLLTNSTLQSTVNLLKGLNRNKNMAIYSYSYYLNRNTLIQQIGLKIYSLTQQNLMKMVESMQTQKK